MNVDISSKDLTKIPEKYKDKIIDGDFNCSYNNLTSLEGGPKEVKGHFNCSENHLTSLKGAPEKVNRSFFCYYNKLTLFELLKGILKMKIGGKIYYDFDNNIVNRFYNANNRERIKLIFRGQ